MKRFICALVLVGASGLSSIVLSVVPSWAGDSDAARSTADIDRFVQDFRAHKKACDHVTSSQAEKFKRCKNEEAALRERQNELGVSDETLRHWIYH